MVKDYSQITPLTLKDNVGRLCQGFRGTVQQGRAMLIRLYGAKKNCIGRSEGRPQTTQSFWQQVKQSNIEQAYNHSTILGWISVSISPGSNVSTSVMMQHKRLLSKRVQVKDMKTEPAPGINHLSSTGLTFCYSNCVMQLKCSYKALGHC